MKTIRIENESGILAAAKEFVNNMGQNKIFAFYGKMGAGKTTFIKAICKILNVSDVVSSPTFAIINEYESAKTGSIFHFDFYRIKDKTELLDIGFEDYIYSDMLCFIEWPEKAEELIPPEAVKIQINVQDDETRIVTME